MVINPLLLYSAGAALVVGALGGWTVRDWKADADALRVVEAANKAKGRMTVKVEQSSAKLEEVLAQLRPAEIETRNTIREVYRNVEVPADCAVPPAGVRLLDDARVRANAAASGEPVPALRAPDSAAGSADRPGSPAVGG